MRKVSRLHTRKDNSLAILSNNHNMLSKPLLQVHIQMLELLCNHQARLPLHLVQTPKQQLPQQLTMHSWLLKQPHKQQQAAYMCLAFQWRRQMHPQPPQQLLQEWEQPQPPTILLKVQVIILHHKRELVLTIHQRLQGVRLLHSTAIIKQDKEDNHRRLQTRTHTHRQCHEHHHNSSPTVQHSLLVVSLPCLVIRVIQGMEQRQHRAMQVQTLNLLGCLCMQRQWRYLHPTTLRLTVDNQRQLQLFILL
jgi:hypothetical protein